MIPSVQFQACNDTVTSTIHKDIFEKFDVPSVSNLDTEQNMQLSTNQATQFQSDHQLLMHQVEFDESEIAISQDCHSIEVETANDDDMITAACDNTKKIINYTIIGNGLILIEGPRMNFDDETKDSLNDLRPINGIDFLVTVNSDEETENKVDVKRECIELMPSDMENGIIETDELNDDDDVCNIKDEHDDKMQSDTETRTDEATATIENGNCDDDNDGDDDDDSSSEHELTNLGWLIDLKNLAQWPVDTASTAYRKHSNGNAHNSLVNGIMNDIDDEENNIVPAISEKDLSEERFKKFTIQVKQSQKNYIERERIYKMDPLEKPPFNYAQIIAMAMMDRGRMTLKDICKWIQEHFAYFRYNKNWNNSIRHNLSLHFCFTKIARDKTEKGKGGYWELSMNSTKSEKKRIRNRRKNRDDNSRVFYSHRNRLLQRKNAQNKNSTATTTTTATNVKASKNSIKVIPACNNSISISNNTTNDSCNVSSASDASSSIGSNNDETKTSASSSWTAGISGITDAQFVRSLQNVVHTEQLDEEDDIIEDVITNDMIIINGSDLDHSDNEMIGHCNFDKTNGQTTIDSYFVDQSLDQDSQHHQHHIPDANDSILIESNLSNLSSAILNDSSNETFINGGLDQQSNLITTSIISATSTLARSVSTSNVIVEPMPYSLSHMDTVIDIEHEFGHLVNMSDPDLTVDGFFDW